MIQLVDNCRVIASDIISLALIGNKEQVLKDYRSISLVSKALQTICNQGVIKIIPWMKLLDYVEDMTQSTDEKIEKVANAFILRKANKDPEWVFFLEGSKMTHLPFRLSEKISELNLNSPSLIKSDIDRIFATPLPQLKKIRIAGQGYLIRYLLDVLMAKEKKGLTAISLTFTDLGGIPPDSLLSYLKQMRELKEISIVNCPLTDEHFSFFASLGSKIEIFQVLNSSMPILSTFQKFALGCSNLKKLWTLDRDSNDSLYDDETLQLFAKLPNLRSLCLNSCKRVTDQCLHSFKDNKQPLEELGFVDAPISKEAIRELKGLYPRLQWIGPQTDF